MLVACSSSSSNSSTPDTSIKFEFDKSNAKIPYSAGLTIATQLIIRNINTGQLRYESDNTSVATIDSSGVLSIHRVGTTTIKVTRSTDNSSVQELTSTFLLTVEKGNQTALLFDKNPLNIQYQAGATASNIATGGTGTGSITYRIDKTNVATIVTKTGVVNLKGLGTAIVTATKAGDSNYHPISATYALSVGLESSITLGIKNIKFAWNDVTGTDHYRLLSDLGKGGGFVDASATGFVVVPNSTNIKQTTAQADIALHRYIPLVDGPQYLVETCDASNSCNNNPASASLSNAQLNDLIGYFKVGNAPRGDGFGSSVSLSGDGNTLAVGAFTDSAQAFVSGAAYVFVRNSTSAEWTQQAYIKASNAGRFDQFGSSVSLSDDGNTLAVAAIWEQSDSTGVNGLHNNNVEQSGAVYVFTRRGEDWREEAFIKASNTGLFDNFGNSVSLSGDGNSLAVGAPFEDSNSTGVNGAQNNNISTNSGAVYVFTRSGLNWSQKAYIKANNTGAEDYFGFSVSLSDDGNSLAVGARREDSNANGVDGEQNDNSTDTGAVYVFTRSSTTWSQQAYIKASNSGVGDEFGNSVSLSDDGHSLAVGASREDSNAKGVDGRQNNDSASTSGATYVFTSQWLNLATTILYQGE